MGPKQPNLHVVGGTARTPNPPENPYKVAFVTAIVTGVGTILATLGVQAIVNRATRRKSEEEDRQARQQLALQPFMQQPQPMMAPPGYMLVPTAAAPPMASFPPALTFPAAPRKRRAVEAMPANGAPPPWFANWAKRQDARLSKVEAHLQELGDEDDEEYEDEDETG